MKFTQMAKAVEIKRDWIVIDATDKVFGRIITEVATILRGKNKPFYTPHVDCGDYVVIINASKAKFSGNKLETKNYYTHSGYFGSTKTHKMSDMFANNPEKLYKLSPQQISVFGNNFTQQLSNKQKNRGKNPCGCVKAPTQKEFQQFWDFYPGRLLPDS